MNAGTLTVADNELDVAVTAGEKGELHHHLFVRPDKRQILFVWDKKKSPTLQLRARPGTSVTKYALDGTPSTYGPFDGRSLPSVRLEAGTVRIFEIAP